jgi:hypothetical protein
LKPVAEVDMTLNLDERIGHQGRRPGPSSRWSSPIAVGAATVVAALIFTKSAVAETIERPFNPPIGSRWTIESIETEKDEGGDPTTTSTKKTTQLLTYAAKLPDGYRISFQTTASTFEGDTDDPAMMRAAAAAMRGLTYRVVTDLSGKPLRVENLDEVRAALRKLVDVTTGTLADPQVIDAAKKMMAGMADQDDKQAAEHVGRLRMIALGQNTGFKPGESRQRTFDESSSFPTPIRQAQTVTLLDMTPDGAKAHYRVTEVSDPESMRALLLALIGKFDTSDPQVREQIDAIKQMVLRQESQIEIEVIDGMTRNLDIVSITERRLGAGGVRVTTHETLAITPAK